MNKKLNLVFAVVAGLALLAMPATANDLFINEAGGDIAWTPNKAFGYAHLVVSGPNGYHADVTFAPGETPSLSLIDGEDGGYTWSLVVTSAMDDSLRADMEAARAAGDESFMGYLKAEGLFESNSYNGHFVKQAGQLVIPENSLATEDNDVAASAKAALPTKAQTITTDLIVQGSSCVGFDCVSSESFGFDTLRLKENNLRIHFNDTSSSASFPGNDWRIVANDSSNGGANYLAIEDSDAGRQVFKVEAGAPANALYVSDAGDIGVKTATPVVDVHIVEGNTPTLRLAQDGSDGFTPQTWDLAGNETNFFIRDVTNGSKLPFRVEPGAEDNQVYIDSSNKVGIGTNAPSQKLHVRGTDGTTQLKIEEANGTNAQRIVADFSNKGFPTIQMTNSDGGQQWVFTNKNANFEISKVGSGASEFLLSDAGDLTITGAFKTSTNTYPDYVFTEDYNLLSLDEVEAFIQANGHLPNVQSEADVEYGRSVNLTELSVSLLEKVEELTLYTIDQHKTIGSQQETINKQNAMLQELAARLDALEARN